MLKLKLQYFGHPLLRADSLEKDPDAGKDAGQEEAWGCRVTEYRAFSLTHSGVKQHQLS